MVLAVFAAYSGALAKRYADTIGRDVRFPAWTNAIYDLSRYVKAQDAVVYVCDWGIWAPLQTLDADSGPAKYQNIAFNLRAPTPAELRYRQVVLAKHGRQLFVTRTAERQFFKGAVRNLNAVTRGRLVLARTIRGPGGRPEFEVFRYR